MNTDILLLNSTYSTLLIGAAVGSVAGYIGSLMVTKRMTLTAGALGHLTLPGVALALRYHFDVSIGAILFLIAGITLIWLLEKRTDTPIEALTAIVFTSSVAIAFLFLPDQGTETALLGNISQISLFTTILTCLASGLIFIISRYIYKNMILISLSKEIAQAKNIPVARYNFIYLVCIALMIALGVRIVGGLMTAALVAIPASTSRNMSTNLFQYTYLSLACGGFSCITGILLTQLTTIPVGSAIILTSSLLFIVSLIFKRGV